jgi:aldose 1-epimerase
MNVTENVFGHLPDGREVKIFHFETRNKMIVSITNYGGNITSIQMPDRFGKAEEITAGFDDLESYVKGHPHFGVITGRFANRISNGKFRIGNTEYHLPLNDAPNHLHGGPGGFHSKLWDFKVVENATSASLVLNYLSPDLEEGFPGNLMTTVTYTVSDNNDIHIHYQATTDKDTHVNLTNHTYFNLGGFKKKIYDHHISIDSGFFLENNNTQIPTGKLVSCSGTKYDLNKEILLEKAIETYGGIDHCFVLYQARNAEQPVAILTHKPSGRRLTVFTSQPSIQVYTGNNLDGSCLGHNDTVYEKHSAVCLETQHYPDSPNHLEFPSTLLKPGDKYDYEAMFLFEIVSQ